MYKTFLKANCIAPNSGDQTIKNQGSAIDICKKYESLAKADEWSWPVKSESRGSRCGKGMNRRWLCADYVNARYKKGPSMMSLFLNNGGGAGIRTLGTSRFAGFQDRCNRPLCHPSVVRAFYIVFINLQPFDYKKRNIFLY